MSDPPRIDHPDALDAAAVEAWLRERDPQKLAALWRMADDTRCRCVGDEVWLRGLIEISNNCRQRCAYCGISSHLTGIGRYRMAAAAILESAKKAVRYRFGTIVIQAGEDPHITGPWLADVIRAIKAETGLVMTLSMGERPDEDLRAWREAGADRYLLRFETSDQKLYARIHPDLEGYNSSGAWSEAEGGFIPPGASVRRGPGKGAAVPRGYLVSDRRGQLRRMRDMGYEIGTGVMIGLPGQTWASLAEDILLFRQYDMDMLGVGPFVEAPGTPLAGRMGKALRREAGADQVPADELTTLKVVALTRLVCPTSNIPATTALEAIDPGNGRIEGLQKGANVIMPNLTPPRCREMYSTYPGKPGSGASGRIAAWLRWPDASTTRMKTTDEEVAGIVAEIESIGRKASKGAGFRAAGW